MYWSDVDCIVCIHSYSVYYWVLYSVEVAAVSSGGGI